MKPLPTKTGLPRLDRPSWDKGFADGFHGNVWWPGPANTATDALLLGHGFAPELLVGLVRAGLATARVERTFASGGAVEITRVRITDAGRLALTARAGGG